MLVEFFPTAILAGLVLAGFVFAGFSSLAVGGRGAGGGFFCGEAGGLVRVHASSLFFFPVAVITNASESFATLRKGS